MSLSSRLESGFTFLEIVLVIAILGLAITVVSLSFSKLESSQVLDKSSLSVVSVLSEARSATLSALDDSQYGVYFQDDQMVLFKGGSYATSTQGNATTTLHSLVGIRNISLSGGGSVVVFKRLTGSTDQSGTLDVYLRSDPSRYKRISIGGTGVIEED